MRLLRGNELKRPEEVGIHNRKQEHTLTNKAIKKKERKYALDQKSDQEKRERSRKKKKIRFRPRKHPRKKTFFFLDRERVFFLISHFLVFF